MTHRPPEELPNEHPLGYTAQLEGDYRPITDHQFNCIFSSAEFPNKDFLIVEDIDTST